MAAAKVIYLGVGGSVVAVERATGTEIWRTKLKGKLDFVNLAIDDHQIYATVGGELFCLDRATGALQWHNKLTGLGPGIVTMASDENQASQSAAIAEKRRRSQAGST